MRNGSMDLADALAADDGGDELEGLADLSDFLVTKALTFSIIHMSLDDMDKKVEVTVITMSESGSKSTKAATEVGNLGPDLATSDL